MPVRPRIAYFVHDLNDAAVARRVTMLQAAGAEVTVGGFWRGDRPPTTVAGAPAIDLGHTADAALGQRARAVARHVLRPAAIAAMAARADVVIGRNLEALALAVRARRPQQRLVYECLDIHRTLLGTSPPHRAIQAIEARLLRGVDLLLVSSPAFLREHFASRIRPGTRTLLVENKLLRIDAPKPLQPAAPSGPPWTIGWFGMLRCRRTLALLIDLAARMEGCVEVLIAGKPSPAVFDDFEGVVAAAPHCRFVGAYTAEDLLDLYRQCHFAWTIDYFEEGLNSSWLLPNRLYEASAFGVVPIALASVETGRWLSAHNAGLLLGDDADVVEQLVARLTALDAMAYDSLRDRVAAIAPSALVAGRDDCEALLAAIAGS